MERSVSHKSSALVFFDDETNPGEREHGCPKMDPDEQINVRLV